MSLEAVTVCERNLVEEAVLGSRAGVLEDAVNPGGK